VDDPGVTVVTVIGEEAVSEAELTLVVGVMESIVEELRLLIGVDRKDFADDTLVNEIGRDKDTLEVAVVSGVETTEELLLSIAETTVVEVDEEVTSVLSKVDVEVKTIVEWMVTVSALEELEDGVEDKKVVDGITADPSVLFNEAVADDGTLPVPDGVETMLAPLKDGAVPELTPWLEPDEEPHPPL
jgi:hypothetical protein